MLLLTTPVDRFKIFALLHLLRLLLLFKRRWRKLLLVQSQTPRIVQLLLLLAGIKKFIKRIHFICIPAGVVVLLLQPGIGSASAVLLVYVIYRVDEIVGKVINIRFVRCQCNEILQLSAAVGGRSARFPAIAVAIFAPMPVVCLRLLKWLER